MTNTQSVWQVHNHEINEHQLEESKTGRLELNIGVPEDAMITSLLVKFKSPVGLIQLPRKINETTNLQAAVPA